MEGLGESEMGQLKTLESEIGLDFHKAGGLKYTGWRKGSNTEVEKSHLEGRVRSSRWPEVTIRKRQREGIDVSGEMEIIAGR